MRLREKTCVSCRALSQILLVSFRYSRLRLYPHQPTTVLTVYCNLMIFSLCVQMMCSVQLTGYGKANLVNYTKSGRPFWCEIQIQPLISKDMYGDEQITHLLGTMVKTASVDTSKTSSASSPSSDRGEREGTGQLNYTNSSQGNSQLTRRLIFL